MANVTWYHLYEEPHCQTQKPSVECWFPGLGEGENGEVMVKGYQVSVIQDKGVLEISYQRGQWHPTPVLLPGKSMDGGAWWAAVHGVAKSRDTTERLHFHFSLSCIGEGNGNPLQCSCLENPRDGGAWWAVGSTGSHRVGHD